MIGKKYQLVAWTRNSSDRENAGLSLIPSLEWELQEPYFTEIARCRAEEEKKGRMDVRLARRYIRAYEESSRFLILTGHCADGIRFLCSAAMCCIQPEDSNWAYVHTGDGCIVTYCGKLKGEFLRLSGLAVSLAQKYGQEHVLRESVPRQMTDLRSRLLQKP